jgi:CheY-like chemotaxis protein
LDQPATILIADDDSLVRSIMRASLEDDGHSVIEAENGIEAQRLCLQHRPDLMILDVIMPALDGYELCRELRR